LARTLNGGKSRHAALRARDRGRNAAVGQGSPTLKKPLRFAYGPYHAYSDPWLDIGLIVGARCARNSQ
ncbi:MAG: hypothetical protein WCE40_09525, partial [Polyangia bacterium]